MKDIITYTRCNSLDHATELIEEQYVAGSTYFYGIIGEVTFKIRMNKDHEMNDNNNGYFTNTLSIVDADCDTIDIQDGNGRIVTEKGVKGLSKDEVMDVVYFWLRELDMMFN